MAGDTWGRQTVREPPACSTGLTGSAIFTCRPPSGLWGGRELKPRGAVLAYTFGSRDRGQGSVHGGLLSAFGALIRKVLVQRADRSSVSLRETLGCQTA